MTPNGSLGWRKGRNLRPGGGHWSFSSPKTSPPRPTGGKSKEAGAFAPKPMKTNKQLSEPEKEILPVFIHWTFFETIDEDLYAYSRYLEFDPRNYGAFSINLARLSQLSGYDELSDGLCL